MIRIEYKKNGDVFSLKVSGHAETAPKGKDLLCAAVSALVYTLVASIEEDCVILPIEASLNSGNALVRVRAKKEKIGEIEAVFSVINNGFSLLQKNFEKNIVFLRGVG